MAIFPYLRVTVNGALRVASRLPVWQYAAVNVSAGASEETRGNERLVEFALPEG